LNLLLIKEARKMKVIESYGRAIENSDENLFKELFAPQVRLEIPGWSNVQSSSERSIFSAESGGQNRPWNKMHFNG